MAAHGTWKRLGDGSLLTQDAEEGLGHILPSSTYTKTLVALLVLTVFTVAIAQYDFGAMNAVVAVVVATVKAGLVAMFFMHLKFEKKLIVLYAIYPLILLALLVGSNLADIETREKVYPSFGAEMKREDQWLNKVDQMNSVPALNSHSTEHGAAPKAAAH